MSAKQDNTVEVETDVDTVEETEQVPTKSRVSSKAGSKKSTEPKKKKATNLEAAAKREATKKRHEEACNAAADKGLVSYFKLLVEPNFADHLGKTVVASVLESIEALQKVESSAPNGYNAFPASIFKLSSEPKASREKAKQSTKTNSAKPTSQPVIRRKGAKVQEPVEPEPESEEEEHEETDMVDEEEDKASAPAAKPKKNIAQITSSGKTCLALLVSKVTDEALDLTDGSKVKTREDLAKYVYNDEALKETNKSQILRSIITTVDRLSGVMPDSDDKLSEKYLAVVKTANIYGKNKGILAKHTSSYISEYVRLIGHVTAQFLWVAKKQINHNTIEMAMRMLELGNHQYLVANELATYDEPSYSLSEGYFNDAREYLSIVIPPKAPVVRKPRKKTEGDAESSDEPDKKSKKAPAKEPRKPKAVEVEYEDVDEEEDEEAEEAVADEEEEEEEEEEPEEVPKKTRSLKPRK